MNSIYLDDIIKNSNRTANLQIVFVDIIKYSKRRTLNQITIIDKFMENIKNALDDTSKEYVKYCQQNNVNFLSDIIFIPTGDGAAIVFPFNGLHDVHLFFATSLLKWISSDMKDNCDKFSQNLWCNCHNYFGIRIGISEGKGIIYKDINDNYNVAGNVINLASRVMGLAEYNQIMFSEEAFKQIIDLDDKPDLIDNFIEYKGVKVKHGLKINIYQYRNEALKYINSLPSDELVAEQKMEYLIEKFNELPKIPTSQINPNINKKETVEILEKLVDSIFNGTSDKLAK